MILDPVETLQALVRIPSVNPMGREFSGEEFLEHKVTNYLEGLFKELKLPYERHTVAPLRDNIFCRLDGSPSPEKGGKILMLEVHQDTVPITGMTISPFAAELSDGRIYGRGACDIKGGMAAMLVALSRLAKEKKKKRPTIVLACTVNEEHGFTGASHLAKMFTRAEGHPTSQLLPRVPDAAIVAEPTLLNVVVAHKGTARWRCHTHGKAGHSSQPHLGDNAIYHMARVLQAFEQYAANVVPHLGSHPLVGHPTLSVGTIGGGLSVNTIPDRCTIEVDRRVLPGDEPDEAWQHAVDYVNSMIPAGTPVVHDSCFLSTRGLNNDANGELAERLSEVAQAQGAPGEPIGVPYGTDAPPFAAAGCQAVVFGPGSIAQAHTADEWLEVEQLEKAAEIYFEFCRREW